MPKLAVVERDDPPLSGARAELCRATEQLTAAMAENDRAQAPRRRLGEAIAAHGSAEADRAARQAAYEAEVGAWIAGGEGPRPELPAELLEAERKVIARRADAAAARSALPAADAAAEEANRRIGAVSAARDDALSAVLLEEMQRFAESEFLPAVLAARRAEAMLHGLEGLLWRRGHGEAAAIIARVKARAGVAFNVHALSTADAAAAVAAFERAKAAPSHEVAAAEQLSERLMSDPTAKLETE